MPADWNQLSIAIIGRGISYYTSIDLGNRILQTAADGLAAATSLRRADHRVIIYDRTDYAGEFGPRPAAQPMAHAGCRNERRRAYRPAGGAADTDST